MRTMSLIDEMISFFTSSRYQIRRSLYFTFHMLIDIQLLENRMTHLCLFFTSVIWTGRNIRNLCWETRWLCTSPTWSRPWSTSASCSYAPTPPGSLSTTATTRITARMELISMTLARSALLMKSSVHQLNQFRLYKIFALLENVPLMEKNVLRICTTIRAPSRHNWPAVMMSLWQKKVQIKF